VPVLVEHVLESSREKLRMSSKVNKFSNDSGRSLVVWHFVSLGASPSPKTAKCMGSLLAGGITSRMRVTLGMLWG